MPIFEYRCLACGHQFEALVRGSSAVACPSCQGSSLERVLSAFAVSSDARSHASLQAARRQLTSSRDRQDRLRHEQEEIRDHLQEDYGLRVPKPQD
jgi:putative FmdB family regulatory protein